MIVNLLPTTPTDSGTLIYSADDRGYNRKPKDKDEIGAIRKRLGGAAAHTQSTPQELAELIASGHTIQGAQLRDKTNPDENTDSRFLRQQLFFVDIDNDEKHADGKKYRTAHPISSHDDILRISRAAGLEPAIIAESFSSGKTDPNGDPIPKYHVIFAAAEPIQTATEARHVLLNLLGVFGGADEMLKDPARILFGSPADKPLYVQNVTNSPAALLSCYTAPEPEPAQPAELPAPAPTSRSSSTAPGRPEEADPDYLLSMIDVNVLEYPEWLRVSAAYKVAGGSLEIWEQWSGQYTGGKKSTQEQARENRATWKSLTGKGVTKGSLKRFAKQHSPTEYDSYIQALTPSKSTRSKSKRKTQSAAPEIETQTETAAEQFGGSQTVEEPAGELLEITEGGGSPQWVPLEFPEWLEKPANYVDFAFIDEKDKVHIVAYLLADNVRKTSYYIFVRGANPSEPVRRFWYIGGVYRPVNDEYIKNKIRERLEVFGAIHCKKTYIEEAFYQLCLDECYHTDSELNADPALINFENGVLNINTLELTPHTPELLSTVQIPCNYVPGLELKDCPTFTQFISRLANYDNDSTAALIEYIGAVISNVDGSRFKKALFLRGAGNCGKSKYIELLRRLLSDEYYATASLEKLESRFGAYSLYNRRLIGDPDIKYLKVSELNTFKQATGGDPLQLEQKGKMPFSFKYSGFMIFGCNELPLFGGDNGKWVYDRMLLIRCGDPVTEQERDPHILEKMYTERAAIVSVAVQYLRACIKRKYRFSEGISSQHLLATYRNDNDPVRAFLAECCLLREEGAPLNGDIQQRDFYRAYCNWYDDNGNRSRPSVQQFRRALTHAADVYDIKQLERKSGDNRYYIYTLTKEARQRYAPQSYDYGYHATGL